MKLNVNLVNNRVVWLCLSSRVSGLIRQFYCNDPPWNKAFLQTCTICMVESKIIFQVVVTNVIFDDAYMKKHYTS